jgi:hypothetical protein
VSTYSLDDVRRAGVPDSWECVDCGTDTAPGFPTAARTVEEISRNPSWIWSFIYTERCEVYCVRPTVWAKASAKGCLCIGCLEERIGRRLRPKDFVRGHSFNDKPGTDRLISRRMGF